MSWHKMPIADRDLLLETRIVAFNQREHYLPVNNLAQHEVRVLNRYTSARFFEILSESDDPKVKYEGDTRRWPLQFLVPRRTRTPHWVPRKTFVFHDGRCPDRNGHGIAIRLRVTSPLPGEKFDPVEEGPDSYQFRCGL